MENQRNNSCIGCFLMALISPFLLAAFLYFGYNLAYKIEEQRIRPDEIVSTSVVWFHGLMDKSPDGALFAVCGDRGTMIIRVSDKTTLTTLPHDSEKEKNVERRALRFSPDSQYLAIGYGQVSSSVKPGIDNSYIEIRRVSDLSLVKILQGHTSSVEALCWNPAGKWLYSGSTDSTIRVWNLHSGECEKTIPVLSPVSSMDITPDGAHLAGGTQKNKAGKTALVIWNTADWTAAQELLTKEADGVKIDRTKPISSCTQSWWGKLCFSPDGKNWQWVLPVAL